MVRAFKNTLIIFSSLLFCFAQQEDSLKVGLQSLKKIESDVIIISAEVRSGNLNPTAYRFSVFPRHRPSEIYISRMFFPGDSLQVVLPENILDADSLANIASLEPVGGSFEKSYKLFSKQSDVIDLGIFDVKKKSDIVKLSVVDGQTGSPVLKPTIKIFQLGKVLYQTVLDSSGYGRLRIPIDRNREIPLYALIDTDGRYPLWRGSIEVSQGVSSITLALNSMSLMIGESLFRVRSDLTPFRKGPENGSEILFMLSKDDHIVISRSAGNKLYGRVRLDLHTKKSSNFFHGWIRTKDVEYLETFATDTNHD